MESLKTYDPSEGAISTYCMNRIKWGLLRAYKQYCDPIRKPDGVMEQYRQYLKLVQDYRNTYGAKPSERYTAAVLEMSVDSLREMVQAFKPLVSIHTPIGEEDLTLEDTIEDERDDFETIDFKLQMKQLRIDLERMMEEKLTYLDREILKEYYSWDCDHSPTVNELAIKYDLTDNQVKKKLSNAIQAFQSYRNELTKHYPEIITKQVYSQEWSYLGEIRRMVGRTVSSFIKIGALVEIDGQHGMISDIKHDARCFDFRYNGRDMTYQFSEFRDLEMQDREIRKLFTKLELPSSMG